MLKKNESVRNIITRKNISNAFRLTLSLGGSTNLVLHTLAIAQSANISLSINDLEVLCDTTPILARMYPSTNKNIYDFDKAGGVGCLLHSLMPLLYQDALTVTGKTLQEIYNNEEESKDFSIITSLENPFSEKGGIAVLWGNLAPFSAITKPAAIPENLHKFSGPARVFNNEEEADEAIINHRIKKGDVLVIRYEGPKGGPGMREMARTMKLLVGTHLQYDVALITDGRFSGSNNGLFVGHISPEASEGGPIAFVENGDIISIDIDKKSIQLCVEDEIIEKRRMTMKRPNKMISSRLLRKFAQYSSSAHLGAIMMCDNEVMTCEEI